MLSAILRRPARLSQLAVAAPLRVATCAYSTAQDPPQRKAPRQFIKFTQLERENLPPPKVEAAYIRFSKEFVQSNTTIESVTERMRIAGEKWRSMSAAEKARYEPTQAEVAEAARRKEKWQETVDLDVLDAINKKRKAGGLKRLIKVTKAFQRPKVCTAYGHFIADFWKNHVAADASTEEKSFFNMAAKAADTWKLLSEEEKKFYKDKRIAQLKVREEWEAKRDAEKAEAQSQSP